MGSWARCHQLPGHVPFIKPMVTSPGIGPPLPPPPSSSDPLREHGARAMTADSHLLVLMTEISLVLPLQKPSKAGFLIAASSFQLLTTSPRPTPRPILPQATWKWTVWGRERSVGGQCSPSRQVSRMQGRKGEEVAQSAPGAPCSPCAPGSGSSVGVSDQKAAPGLGSGI